MAEGTISKEYHSKILTVFDGIETDFFKPATTKRGEMLLIGEDVPQG